MLGVYALKTKSSTKAQKSLYLVSDYLTALKPQQEVIVCFSKNDIKVKVAVSEVSQIQLSLR